VQPAKEMWRRTRGKFSRFEDKRFGEMIARDFKALEAMLHGDLLYTHSSGVTDTKATWLQFDAVGQDQVQKRQSWTRLKRYAPSRRRAASSQ
jgi:hypothetical protein